MECLFCKIAKGEINIQSIYESDNAVAFLDINPRSPGHTLVVPKKHFEKLTDFSDKDLGEFFKDVKKVVLKISKALKPDGFTLGINEGKASGQAIEHMHFHIMPRWNSDKGGSIHSVVNNKPSESLEKIREKILKA